MFIEYPYTLPELSYLGATIRQVPVFKVFKTCAGMTDSIRRKNIGANPPLEYTTKIQLFGKQIALFDSWYVEKILNGAKRFYALFPLLIGKQYAECQFAMPPSYAEIGDHKNPIREVDCRFYVYNPLNTYPPLIKAGVYPNIPAPLVQSLSATKSSVVQRGILPYGNLSSTGMQQGAEQYTLTLLLTYAQARIFSCWWTLKQLDGLKSFTIPLLTSAGIKEVRVRPLSSWAAKCKACDVEITLQVEVTRPPLPNKWEELASTLGKNTADLIALEQQTDGVWNALSGR